MREKSLSLKKNPFSYARPITQLQLLKTLSSMTTHLRRKGTIYLCGVEYPLGLPLRGPCFVSTIFLLSMLLKYDLIRFSYENHGSRVLVDARPRIFELSERLEQEVLAQDD